MIQPHMRHRRRWLYPLIAAGSLIYLLVNAFLQPPETTVGAAMQPISRWIVGMWNGVFGPTSPPPPPPRKGGATLEGAWLFEQLQHLRRTEAGWSVNGSILTRGISAYGGPPPLAPGIDYYLQWRNWETPGGLWSQSYTRVGRNLTIENSDNQRTPTQLPLEDRREIVRRLVAYLDKGHFLQFDPSLADPSAQEELARGIDTVRIRWWGVLNDLSVIVAFAAFCLSVWRTPAAFRRAGGCPRCGYDLRSLAATGITRCPECGRESAK